MRERKTFKAPTTIVGRMLPPNVGPPKNLVFVHPGQEQKLREQFVYQGYVSEEERAKQKMINGNRLVIKFRDEVVGEGQINLIEKTNLESLSAYDAILSGFENVDALRNHLVETVLKGERKPAHAEFFRVLFRWL